MMKFDDALDHREAYTQSSTETLPTSSALHKDFANRRQVLRRYAVPVVLHRNFDRLFIGFTRCGQPDVATFGRVADRVRQKVRDDLAQTDVVAMEPNVVVEANDRQLLSALYKSTLD